MNEEDKIMSLGSPVEDLEFVYLLRSRLHSLLQLTRYQDMFPGSQPVSFEKKHLDLLEREDYYVCEKSDGVRYLLYFAIPPSGPVAFLALENLTLPTRDLKNFQEETLIDGELVWDAEKAELVYYIFDGLMFMARNLCNLDLNGRLQVIQNDVISPYNARESLKLKLKVTERKADDNLNDNFIDNLNDNFIDNVIDKSNDNLNEYLIKSFPFKMKMKQMWKPYGLRELFERVIPLQGHENDGLIFTPVHDTYQSGTCHRLLKWKPSDMNSIDFLIINGNELHIATQGRTHFYKEFEPLEDEKLMKFVEECDSVNVNTNNSGSDSNNVKSESTENLIERYLNGKIAEFRLDLKNDKWKFMRLRADKRLPNDSKTVEKVLHSIRDNVSKENLMEREGIIRANWKAREKNKIVVTRDKSRDIPCTIVERDLKPRSQIIDYSIPKSSPPFKYPLNLRNHEHQYSFSDGWVEEKEEEVVENELSELDYNFGNESDDIEKEKDVENDDNFKTKRIKKCNEIK